MKKIRENGRIRLGKRRIVLLGIVIAALCTNGSCAVFSGFVASYQFQNHWRNGYINFLQNPPSGHEIAESEFTRVIDIVRDYEHLWEYYDASRYFLEAIRLIRQYPEFQWELEGRRVNPAEEFPRPADVTTGVITIASYRGSGGAVTIPATESLTIRIGNSAFAGSQVTSVIIPDSVTRIGDTAFAECTNLISVTFPAATSIGINPFAICTSLTSFILTGTGPLSVMENGRALIRNGTELVSYPSASGNVTMGDITSIGGVAFLFTSVVSVSFPNVTSIGRIAFRGCARLTSASFPNVTSIDDNAFACHCNVQSGNDHASDCSSPVSLTSVTLGTIAGRNFPTTYPPFHGNLREVYFAAGGGAGTYVTSNPGQNPTWRKR